MLVKEYISFERGADPKAILGIGEPKLIHINMENNSLHNFLFKKEEYNLRNILGEWNIYHNGDRIYHNINGSLEDGSVISNTKLLIIQYSNKHTNESLSFERGADPKKVLGIGDLKYMWNNLKEGTILKLKKTIRNSNNYKKGFLVKVIDISSRNENIIDIKYEVYINESNLLNNLSKRKGIWSITYDYFIEEFIVVKL